MAKVSVVMPVRGYERFLADAVDSVLAQTLIDFELIAVCENDSDRKTLETLEAYRARDPRVVPLRNQRRLGISASLNEGIRRAAGEYVARMDADDISLPERLRLQTEFMDAHPDIAICGTNAEFIDEAGRKLYARDDNPTSHEQIKSDLLFYCCLRHPTVMMRREAVLAHGLFYDTGFETTEDFELWNRACHVARFANLPRTLLLYRWYSGNATHARSEEGTANYLRVMARSLRRLRVEPSEAELRRLCPFTCRLEFFNHGEICRALADRARQISEANSREAVYESSALEATLAKRLYWRKHPSRMYLALLARWIGRRTKRSKWMSLASHIEISGFYKTLTRALVFAARAAQRAPAGIE